MTRTGPTVMLVCDGCQYLEHNDELSLLRVDRYCREPSVIPGVDRVALPVNDVLTPTWCPHRKRAIDGAT